MKDEAPISRQRRIFAQRIPGIRRLIKYANNQVPRSHFSLCHRSAFPIIDP